MPIIKLEGHGYIDKIVTLGLENDLEVQATLTKICHDVKPIMEKYNWHIKKIKEFIPKERHKLKGKLYRSNKKSRVVMLLQLRKPKSLELDNYAHLLKIFLHELAHLKVVEHSTDFYQFLQQITDEFETDQQTLDQKKLFLIRSRKLRGRTVPF